METTIPAESISQDKPKAPRQRSSAYTSYTLEFCITFTGLIFDKFSDLIFIDRNAIGEALDMSGGSFQMKLGSCVQYNLLEVKQSEGYKPTTLFKKIKRPMPGEKVHDFYMECLWHPELYKKLLADFQGKQLPQPEGLANILDRKYSVVGDASLVAAKIFLANLEKLELIGENNTLNLDGGITPIEDFDNLFINGAVKNDNQSLTNNVVLLNHPQNDTNTAPNQNLLDVSKYSIIPVKFKDGTEGKILMPLDFNDEHWIKLAKIVSGYLP